MAFFHLFPLLFILLGLVTCQDNPAGVAGEGNVTSDIGYDTEPLQKLTENRQQHRKTIDGRLCAAAFVQDDQTYTDCTVARAPDGSSGREWCYLEVQLLGKGPKDWNFCTPSIDYDKVRAKARELFGMKAGAVEKMIERLDGETRRVKDMMNRYNATCGSQHEATEGRINAVDGLVSKGRHCVEKIGETVSRINLMKSAIEHVESDYERSKKRAAKMCENCARVAGYEDDPAPDGIRGAYYSNSLLEGPPREFRTDKHIDLVVSGKGPVEGVSPHQFSIRWDGYLLAPDDGSYIFSTETDCGARVWINGKPIIVDRMPEATEKDYHIEGPVKMIPIDEVSGIHKRESEPQELVGGQKVKIRVEMIHSGHMKAQAADTAIMRLYWRAGNVQESVIPSKYFFTSNAKPPLHASGLDAAHFDISMLYDGEFAFKDSKDFFIADVPQRLEGRRFVRTVMEPFISKFSMQVNAPALIYVASLLDEPLPLGPPEEFPWVSHDSEELLSIYKATSRATRALESRMFKIRFIELREAGSIHFNILHKKQPFIILLEQKRQPESACGGEVEVLSLTSGTEYAGCHASSEESADYTCESALNGKHLDQPNGTWRTSGGNGVGEFISIKFKRPIEIASFRFKPRDDPVTWPAEITLSFTEEEDDTQTFAILHSNNLEHNTHALQKPVITKYVKAEITQMYVNGEDSGGSFEFLGSTCDLPDVAPSIGELTVERCDMSIENLPKALPLEDGEQFIIICPEDCVRSPEGHVYGSGPYAPESTLCLTSIHAGSCNSSKHGPCKFLLTANGPHDHYTSSVKNGISSSAHGPDEMSLVFTSYESETPSIAEEDEDIYHISFQADKELIIAGHVVDHGGVKKRQQNVVFGWLKPARGETCPEESSISNPLDLPGLSFPPPAGSAKCSNGADCEPNFWSLDIKENGTYRVEVRVGHKCLPATGSRTYFIQVNGHPLVEGTSLTKGEFYNAVIDLEVSDKTILITSDCTSAGADPEKCNNADTTLSYVTIEKVQNKKQGDREL